MNNSTSIEKILYQFIILLILLGLIACQSTNNTENTESQENTTKSTTEGTTSRPELFPDQVDGTIYTNTPLGFSLDFGNQWTLYTKYEEFPDFVLSVADELQTDFSELLFFAHSADSLKASRAVVEILDLPLMQYVNLIKEVNKAALKEDLGTEEITLQGQPVIVWTYSFEQGDSSFRFVDYFWSKDQAKLRISFYTLESLFNAVKPEFDAIIQSRTLF
jgi:hypothetical protein